MYNRAILIISSLFKMKGVICELKIKIKSSLEFDEVLIRRGFSRRAFARRAGIGESTIIQICNNDRNPSPQTAKKICETLEIDFDQIFEIVNPKVAGNC